MIILRIILGIVAFPFLILAYLLKGFFYILTLATSKLIITIGGLIILGGLVWIGIPLLAWNMESLGANFGGGIGLILGGSLVCFTPWIGSFLFQFFDVVAEWIKLKFYRF